MKHKLMRQNLNTQFHNKVIKDIKKSTLSAQSLEKWWIDSYETTKDLLF